MRKVSVAEARRQFRTLLDDVATGKQIAVLRRGREVARLVPPPAKGARRLPALGAFRRSISIRGRLSDAIVRARREERY
jgi:prevent-host-death family protein